MDDLYHTITSHVIAIVSANTSAVGIHLGSDLDELGLDSLGLLEVGCELEGLYGDKAYIGGNDLDRIHTVKDLVDHIYNR